MTDVTFADKSTSDYLTADEVNEIKNAVNSKEDESALGTAAYLDSEDTLTDGSNLPKGSAIITYGDANWGLTPTVNILDPTDDTWQGKIAAAVAG